MRLPQLDLPQSINGSSLIDKEIGRCLLRSFVFSSSTAEVEMPIFSYKKGARPPRPFISSLLLNPRPAQKRHLIQSEVYSGFIPFSENWSQDTLGHFAHYRQYRDTNHLFHPRNGNIDDSLLPLFLSSSLNQLQAYLAENVQNLISIKPQSHLPLSDMLVTALPNHNPIALITPPDHQGDLSFTKDLPLLYALIDHESGRKLIRACCDQSIMTFDCTSKEDPFQVWQKDFVGASLSSSNLFPWKSLLQWKREQFSIATFDITRLEHLLQSAEKEEQKMCQALCHLMAPTELSTLATLLETSTLPKIWVHSSTKKYNLLNDVESPYFQSLILSSDRDTHHVTATVESDHYVKEKWVHARPSLIHLPASTTDLHMITLGFMPPTTSLTRPSNLNSLVFNPLFHPNNLSTNWYRRLPPIDIYTLSLVQESPHSIPPSKEPAELATSFTSPQLELSTQNIAHASLCVTPISPTLPLTCPSNLHSLNFSLFFYPTTISTTWHHLLPPAKVHTHPLSPTNFQASSPKMQPVRLDVASSVGIEVEHQLFDGYLTEHLLLPTSSAFNPSFYTLVSHRNAFIHSFDLPKRHTSCYESLQHPVPCHQVHLTSCAPLPPKHTMTVHAQGTLNADIQNKSLLINDFLLPQIDLAKQMHLPFSHQLPPLVSLPPFSQMFLSKELARTHNQTTRLTHMQLTSLPTLELLKTDSLGEEFEAVLRTTMKKTGDGSLFSLLLSPHGNAPLDPIKSRIYFVIDCSTTIEEHRFYTFKRAVAQAINYLHPTTSFNVLTFDNVIKHLEEHDLVPSKKSQESIKKHLKVVKQRARSQLPTFVRWMEAMKRRAKEHSEPHLIVLLSDGRFMKNIHLNRDAMAQLSSNLPNNFALFAISASDNNNRGMLDLVTHLCRGETIHARTHSSFPRKLAALTKRIHRPIGYAVKVTQIDGGPETVLHTETDQLLFADKTFKIFGETAKGAPARLIVQAYNGKRWLNIPYKMQFANAVRSTSRLQSDFARHEAQPDLLTFIRTGNLSALQRAKKQLTDHQLPAPVN